MYCRKDSLSQRFQSVYFVRLQYVLPWPAPLTRSLPRRAAIKLETSGPERVPKPCPSGAGTVRNHTDAVQRFFFYLSFFSLRSPHITNRNFL